MSQVKKKEKIDFNFLISTKLKLPYLQYDQSDSNALKLLQHWQENTPYDFEINWSSGMKNFTVILFGKNYGISYKGTNLRDAIVEAFKDLYLSEKKK